MDADKPVPWVRDWLNSRVSHRSICVHLRSSAAKIPCFLLRQAQPTRNPDKRRQQSRSSGADRSGVLETLYYAANSINCRTGAPDFSFANPSLISSSLIRPEIR
jgi:hypothetical protein